MKNLNVMIVDDSAIITVTLSRILTDMGHTIVATAKTGEEAIHKFSLYKPELITMDITMPDLNGISAVKSIMQIDSKVLIIMVTSQGQEQLVVESISSGAKGYILKPLSPDKLKETVETVIDRYYDK